MAKRGALAPVIVQMPARRSGGRFRRAASRGGHFARRAGRRVARGVNEEKLALAAVGGAGLVGFLEASGNLSFVPDFGLGRTATLAVAAYGIGRLAKSNKLRLAGIGLAAAAAFEFGQSKGRK